MAPNDLKFEKGTATLKDNSVRREFPSEEELFKQIMLTSDTVWHNKLTRKDIERWLNNFKGKVFNLEYERRIALFLLAHFVFYNEDEVRHLCKTLYKKFLHYMLLRTKPIGKPGISLEIDSILYSSRFYHLGKAGESGAFVLYYFRHENRIPMSYISDPSNLPEYVSNIVYVDDASISGEQAKGYLEGQLKESIKDKDRILLTFISTDEAEDLLKSNNIQVISCITLDERSKCFSNNSSMFHYYKDYYNDCEKFALEYGKKCLRNHPTPINPLGFDDGQYTFGFFYNTPDNVLPIYWIESREWSPIVKRYEKVSEAIYHDFGRFI